jgi:hypothetical protein
MKVYYVWVDKCDYDYYDSLIIVAENKERALEMVKHGKWNNTSYFEEWQGEIHIEEVDLTKEHIVIESFNAG